MDAVARLELECDASAVADARHFVEATLWALEVDALAEDAALLTSELASNAVTHARTEIVVSVAVSADLVRISVADQNTRLPTVSAIPADATSGRGLHLVAAIANDWGVDSTGDGKAIWADLSRRIGPSELDSGDLKVIDLRDAPPSVQSALPLTAEATPSGHRFGVGQPVEIRVSFTDSWSGGFVVAGQVSEGYEIRRVSDGRLLPPPTSAADIRADWL